ncbi:Cytochrome P450 [Ophiocordyceps camponoti-floridani]|uniref:Cytochrome P450 n=1 Tax=Ophiocordyceps camponoti-floridani TaxID=2030778 RepID=A0A8H4Q5Q7_9HYPO|nr:Cytochrome P450 [Ophiocordyceps camponoti-floridani]
MAISFSLPDGSALSSTLFTLRQSLKPLLALTRSFALSQPLFSHAWGLVPSCIANSINGPPLDNLPRAVGYPVLGILPEICSLGLYSNVMNRLFDLASTTGISCSSVGPIPIIYLRDPDIIRQVLVSHADSITRLDREGNGPFGISQRLNGLTAATAEGESWHRWRNGLERSFQSTKSLRRAFPDMVRLAQRQVQRMVHQGSGPDLRQPMEAFALDTVWFLTLGIDDMSTSSDEIAAIMSQYGSIVGSPSHLWRHVIRNLLSGKPYREPDRIEQDLRRRIDDFVTQLLSRNLASDSASCQASLLRQSSADKSKAAMTHEVLTQARQVFSLGHEASALILIWAVYELSLHPDVVRRLRRELIDHNCTLDHIDFDRLRALPYLEAVVAELLRLHPPISTTARMATKPIVVETSTNKLAVLPQGSQIFSSVHLLHRDRQIWGDSAASFDPDRWQHRLPNSAQNRCEYLPFLTGSRSCPSSGFVILQLKTMLAAMLLRVDVQVPDAEKVEKCFGGVIRPAKPIAYKVREIAT